MNDGKERERVKEEREGAGWTLIIVNFTLADVLRLLIHYCTRFI